MSEIQCNNITTSSKRFQLRKTREVRNALRKIVSKSMEEDKGAICLDKSAIINLVKFNLQKMCSNNFEADRWQCDQENQQHLHNQSVHYDEDCNYDSERSRSTKELLRKTILEKRSLQFALEMKRKEFCVDLKQKIWRPW